MSYLLCVINTNGAGEVFIQWFKEGQRILQLIWVRDFKFDLVAKVIDATQIEQPIEGKRLIKPIFFVRASSANVRSWSGAN